MVEVSHLKPGITITTWDIGRYCPDHPTCTIPLFLLIASFIRFVKCFGPSHCPLSSNDSVPGRCGVETNSLICRGIMTLCLRLVTLVIYVGSFIS